MAEGIRDVLARLPCRLDYTNLVDNRDASAITLFARGKRQPPYNPLGMVVFDPAGVAFHYDPSLTATGLDGNNWWDGKWNSTKLFEYSDPGLQEHILELAKEVLRKQRKRP